MRFLILILALQEQMLPLVHCSFATAPGKTASDGNDKNGLYTQEILNTIYKQDLKVEELFKRVRVSVMSKSKNRQIPWETSSLINDFYFNPATM